MRACTRIQTAAAANVVWCHAYSVLSRAVYATLTVARSDACVSCLQRADQALGDFFQSIVNTMAGLFQVATGQKQAQVSIAPPSFFNNGAANVSTSVAGVAGAVSPPPPSSQSCTSHNQAYLQCI